MTIFHPNFDRRIFLFFKFEKYIFFSLFFVHLCVSEHKLSYQTLKCQQTKSNKTKIWSKIWLKITNYLLISSTNQLLNKALDIKVQWIQSQHLNCNKIFFWLIKMKLLCWLYRERQKELSWNITSEIFIIEKMGFWFVRNLIVVIINHNCIL